jgi:excisionase family DNA binding protein
METKLMKVSEVAEVINASIPRTYELLRLKIIPSIRMGRQVRVSSEALFEWIRQGGRAEAGDDDLQ